MKRVMRVAWYCVGISVAANVAAAQTGDEAVVAPGPQALTRNAVRQIGAFLEFALDSKFTAEEMSLFERAEIDSWRTSTQKQREDSLQIARMQAVIENLGQAERAEVKKKVQPQMLAMLQNTPQEPVSKLLLGIYQRGQVSSAPVVQPVAAAVSGGRMPAQLVGEWMSMSTSSVTYVDRTTGSSAPPSGNGGMYKFFPDGRYEYAGLLQSSMYNCTMTITPFERGTVRIEGNTIHFDSAGGTLTSKDNCNRQYNYEKPIPPNTTTYTWRLERDQYGVKFCYVKPGVKESCAYRK